MNAAIYLRVSTDDQDVDNQEGDCVRLCQARGWEAAIVPEVESGAKDRPRWRHVLELARTGTIRAVVIWSIDRMGRRMHELLADVRELDRLGCAVVSVRESWLDTTSPTRDLLLAIFAWLAEHERRRLIERTRAGLERARREGKKLGRPPLPVSSLAADRIRELRTVGWSFEGIRARLVAEGWPSWSSRTIRRIAYGAKTPVGYSPLRPPSRQGFNSSN